MNSCIEAGRLLDIYVAALNAFQDAQTPILSGMRPGDPEFHSAIKKKDTAHMDLLRARRWYWDHIKAHKCRERSN